MLLFVLTFVVGLLEQQRRRFASDRSQRGCVLAPNTSPRMFDQFDSSVNGGIHSRHPSRHISPTMTSPGHVACSCCDGNADVSGDATTSTGSTGSPEVRHADTSGPAFIANMLSAPNYISSGSVLPAVGPLLGPQLFAPGARSRDLQRDLDLLRHHPTAMLSLTDHLLLAAAVDKLSASGTAVTDLRQTLFRHVSPPSTGSIAPPLSQLLLSSAAAAAAAFQSWYQTATAAAVADGTATVTSTSADSRVSTDAAMADVDDCDEDDDVSEMLDVEADSQPTDFRLNEAKRDSDCSTSGAETDSISGYREPGCVWRPY